MADRPLHGGGPAAPVRPRRRGVRRGRRGAPGGRDRLRGGRQQVHLRGAAAPARLHPRPAPPDQRQQRLDAAAEASRRVRRDHPQRPARGAAHPAAVEGDRRDRHRLDGRRHLRQGRRPRARRRADPRAGRRALRRRGTGPGRVRRLPVRRGPGGAGHGRRQLPVPGAARTAGPGERRAPRPGHGAGDGRRGDARPERPPGRDPAGVPGRRLERAAGERRRVRVGPAADGLRPPDRLLLAADPDGDRHPRTGREHAARPAPGNRRARRRLPRREHVRAARPRPRLRLERDLGGTGHHRHLRARAVRAGRGRGDARLGRLPLPRRVRAHRDARAPQPVDHERRRPVASRHRDAPDQADEARPRGGARADRRPALRLHAAPLDLLPRSRLGARVRGLQRPRRR